MHEGLAKIGSQPAPPSGSGCDHSAAGAERFSWALRQCEKLHLRMTEARRAVLACLASHEKPLNLDAISDADELKQRFNAATIYRSVMLLKEAKLVREIRVQHKHRCFALNSPEQSVAYLICRGCGSISAAETDKIIAELFSPTIFFKIEALEIHGLCPKCLEKGEFPSSKLPVS
jgi:Fur family transcriptional regulator, zinc uptake regulator